MKPHFQCVEQLKSPSNLTKYCTCHAKWMSSMICVTYETSFPMRGATKVTLQPHQILRLPRSLEAQDFSGYSLNASANRKTIRGYPRIIRRYPRIKSSSRTRRLGDLTLPILETILYCKIQHFASRLSPKMSRSAAPVTKSHPPTSPNTAPATQNECHQWSASHMKPHFQCVEQVKSPSNLTKYCACHAKWMSSMICVTYETSFPMRGATKVTLQPHQILHLPHKINVISDLRHIWNVISNARSQSSHPPTSPNTAPATKSWRSRFARKIPEVLPPIERRFDDNPRIIRRYPTISDDKIVISHPPLRRPYSSQLGDDLVL